MAGEMNADGRLLAAELRAKRPQILPVGVLQACERILVGGFVAFAPSAVAAVRSGGTDGALGLIA